MNIETSSPGPPPAGDSPSGAMSDAPNEAVSSAGEPPPSAAATPPPPDAPPASSSMAPGDPQRPVRRALARLAEEASEVPHDPPWISTF